MQIDGEETEYHLARSFVAKMILTMVIKINQVDLVKYAIPYSPALWCMHLNTKPRQLCMHHKRVRFSRFLAVKNIAAFRI